MAGPAITVQQHGDWFAVVLGSEPLRTPMGTPVVSRHRALAEEVAADVARWGVDPTAKTTTFSLQASYLDFGLRVRREVLEENTAAIWPDDVFVQRPPEAGLAARLLALWGPAPDDRGAFRESLRGASLRQLLASMTAGHVLRSAVLGHRVATTGADLVPLTRGACGVWFAAASRGSSSGGPGPGRAVRHVPTDLDLPYCEGSCCSVAGPPDAEFTARCALFPLLDKLRRWSALPEEAEKR